MISGERPVTAVETMRASGVSPRSRALVSLTTTTAAAPSLSGQALPAVTRPSGRKTGLMQELPSSVVPRPGPSFVLTTVPSGVVIGVISRSQKPSALQLGGVAVVLAGVCIATLSPRGAAAPAEARGP